MDFKAAMDLGVAISLGLAAFGSAIGLGVAVSSAMGAISRAAGGQQQDYDEYDHRLRFYRSDHDLCPGVRIHVCF